MCRRNLGVNKAGGGRLRFLPSSSLNCPCFEDEDENDDEDERSASPTFNHTLQTLAMVLPALAKAKERAQSISCVTNMKQIGLAFRLWEGDNNDQFPFNVSTGKGGTLELCDRGSDS